MQLQLARLQYLLLTYHLPYAYIQSKIWFHYLIALQNPSDVILLLTKLLLKSHVSRKVGINNLLGIAKRVLQVGLKK